MLNCDGDVVANANANANVKCEHSITLRDLAVGPGTIFARGMKVDPLSPVCFFPYMHDAILLRFNCVPVYKVSSSVDDGTC